jgi:hypothetical protein
MSPARRLAVRRRADLGVVAGYVLELASPRGGHRERTRGRRGGAVAPVRPTTPMAEGA